MDDSISSSSAVKKTNLTAKAIIYQKYGTKACYKIEEFEEPTPNGCPGLTLAQKGPSLFRCFLQLPDFTVVSHPCKKKKDAQQSAAQLALEKLGIDSQSSSPTDAVDELVFRLSYLFSVEFLSSLHPLSSHLKAVLRKEGEHCGVLPLSAVISCDLKLGNLCKSIDARVESNPLLSIPIVKGAVARLSDLIVISKDELWIKRMTPYPSDVIPSFDNQDSDITNAAITEAVLIPVSLDTDVVSFSMNMSLEVYYLDVIAQALGVGDASNVLISRTIGKSSSETRLYFSALETENLIPGPGIHTTKTLSSLARSFNLRASYLLGQHVYGPVILASVGYTWRGAELFREDISLRSYYRDTLWSSGNNLFAVLTRGMVLSKTPDGLFRLSRDAILVADLPVIFTTKTNWRGSLPRDLLCAFCRQHRLSEPVVDIVCISNSVKSEKNLLEIETFRCNIRLFSKKQDLILECFPEESFKKQGDALQNASLKALLWFNMYFKQQSLSSEKLPFPGGCNYTSFLKEFYFCELMQAAQNCHDVKWSQNRIDPQNSLENKHMSMEGTISGSSPSIGSIVSISCAVYLISEEMGIREILERSDEFEFEIGTGAVMSYIESAVVQMRLGQSICFCTDLPPKEFILASVMEYKKVLSVIYLNPCCLEYTVSVLRITEPLEDRMEQALFSPPLSKQRLEFAMKYIKEFSATNLIDFGCGSGSLMESIIGTPSSLEKIVGVDISPKGLIRAAKVLNSKLEKLKAVMATSRIESVTLYDGSITVFDSRLYGFDVGACIEVIEHMEEEQAYLFGDIVLGQFGPKLLIVSTPNYEYNVIMRKSDFATQEDDPDDKGETQSCKFRNHDHKFEWTREQFNQWATGLALKHNYKVEFGGVGGDGAEPGFASQIAVFRRVDDLPVNGSGPTMKADHHYKTLWEWNAGSTVSFSGSDKSSRGYV